MIYQLADHIQGFLSEHNKPPSSSFHEEMLKNQRRQREKLALEEQQRLDQRRKQKEDMVRRGGTEAWIRSILACVVTKATGPLWISSLNLREIPSLTTTITWQFFLLRNASRCMHDVE